MEETEAETVPETVEETEEDMDPIGEDGVFAVETLLKSKKIKGKLHYLVKWQGWSNKHNTWEPAENMLDARLVEAFNEKEAAKSAATPAKKRSSTGSKKSETPVSPPKKRRLAGGDIREESSESSDHETEEEPATTSRSRRGAQNKKPAKEAKKEKKDVVEEEDEKVKEIEIVEKEAKDDEVEETNGDADKKVNGDEKKEEATDGEAPEQENEEEEKSADTTEEIAPEEATKSEDSHVEPGPSESAPEVLLGQTIETDGETTEFNVVYNQDTMEDEMVNPEETDVDPVTERLFIPKQTQAEREAIEQIKSEIRNETESWTHRVERQLSESTITEVTYNGETVPIIEF